jgi:hypothetical protein
MMRLKRLALSGDEQTPVDFPIEVMFSLGMLSAYAGEDPREASARRDKAWHFASMAWSAYGAPFAGCEAVYQRMVAGSGEGVGSPRSSHDGDSAGQIRSSARLAAMYATLRAPGQSREMLTAVQNVAQYLRMPRLVMVRRQGLFPRATDEREIALVRDGLQRLVDLEESRAKAA